MSLLTLRGPGMEIVRGVLRGQARGEVRVRDNSDETELVWMDWSCDLYECPVLFVSEEMLFTGDRCTRLRLANGEDVIFNATYEAFTIVYDEYTRGQAGWRRLFTGRR